MALENAGQCHQSLCVQIWGRSPPFPFVFTDLTPVVNVHTVCAEMERKASCQVPVYRGLGRSLWVEIDTSHHHPRLFMVGSMDADGCCLRASII